MISVFADVEVFTVAEPGHGDEVCSHAGPVTLMSAGDL